MTLRTFQRACQCGRAAAGTAALRRFGHDTVRANLDLPDFFEKLAGDHDSKLQKNREIAESMAACGIALRMGAKSESLKAIAWYLSKQP